MIGILTYNAPHRKTYDVLCLLKTKAYQNVRVYATPLQYEKSFRPIYNHRPDTPPYIPDTASICAQFGYCYVEGKLSDWDIPEDEILLICGAGIIPEEFLRKHTIFNAHPGYLPYCRGLDAYKWAIYEDMPISVTTHLLGGVC